MNEIIKVPFCENEIMVIEKGNRRYVPLKPLVEALGLDWVAQYELVHRDPVLSAKGIRVTVPTRGGPQEMFALGIGISERLAVQNSRQALFRAAPGNDHPLSEGMLQYFIRVFP